MASEKIIVSATDSGGNSVQRTFDNVNPDATSAQLAAFGSKIAGLSENTYAKTDRITRVNCDTEASGGSKQTPTFAWADGATTTLAWSTIKQDLLDKSYNFNTLARFNYNGDGKIFIASNNTAFDVVYGTTIISPYGSVTNYAFRIVGASDDELTNVANHAVTFTLHAEETDNFKSAEITFTITNN